MYAPKNMGYLCTALMKLLKMCCFNGLCTATLQKLPECPVANADICPVDERNSYMFVLAYLPKGNLRSCHTNIHHSHR